MRKRSAQIFGAGLAKAAISPLSLSVGAATGTGAVVIGSWWMLAVTAGSYVLAMALRMSRPGFWKRVGSDLRRRAPRLPHPGALYDEKARGFAGRLARARDDRGRALVFIGFPGAQCPGLERVLGTVRGVEERAVEMTALVEKLGRYLLDRTREPAPKRPDPHASRSGRDAVDRDPSSPSDDGDPALLAAHRGRAALADLFVHHDTVAGRLDALIAALEALPHRIVAAKLRDGPNQAPAAAAVLADMDAELCSVEASGE